MEIVSRNWYISVCGTPMCTLCRKLKSLKGPLKELNKLHFNYIFECVSRLDTELDLHQIALHHDRDNSLLLKQDRLLRLKLLRLKSAENMFFSQKVKRNFLKESDKGSRFFHALTSQNHRRNFILAIQCSHGNLSTSLEEVGAEFVQYYQCLLGTSKATIPLDSVVIQCGPCIDSSSHDFLLSPVSNKDIQKVVFSIENEKARGPDGYSSLFFKQAWGVVGRDFYVVVQDFVISNRLLKQINHLIIALVPKSANVSSTSDFRPISYCNMIYKVIAKILAGRFAHILSGIISPMQNAFLGGRLMSDNINLVQELLRQYNRKRSSPYCLMKVDFRKAFD